MRVPHRIVYWSLRTLLWALAGVGGYVATILLVFATMIGPRGEIDYSDDVPGLKEAADLSTLHNRLAGIIGLVLALALILLSHRIATGLVALLPGRIARREP